MHVCIGIKSSDNILHIHSHTHRCRGTQCYLNDTEKKPRKLDNEHTLCDGRKCIFGVGFGSSFVAMAQKTTELRSSDETYYLFDVGVVMWAERWNYGISIFTP